MELVSIVNGQVEPPITHNEAALMISRLRIDCAMEDRRRKEQIVNDMVVLTLGVSALKEIRQEALDCQTSQIPNGVTDNVSSSNPVEAAQQIVPKVHRLGSRHYLAR